MMRLFALALMLAAPADAAITLQGFGKPARVTVATTTATVTLPAGTEYVVLRPITITGYLAIGCTDGAALGTHYFTITADTVFTYAVDSYGRTDLCLAGSGAGTIEVIPMGRGR
jgi:hypothetical protein